MIKKKIIDKITVGENTTIKIAIKKLNQTGLQILLVVDSRNRFLGTLTDGDIRRSLLNKLSLDNKIEKIYFKNSFVIKKTIPYEQARELMLSRDISHLPVIKKNKVVDLYFIAKEDKKKINNYFVIMAGGFGKRLLPVTKKIPKPMIKINNKPILEHIILRAKSYGFQNFIICTHYKYKKIVSYFGNGNKFNVKISYINEKKPMGTIGGLSLLKKKISKPFIVSNADIISDINFEDLLRFHKLQKSIFTIAVKNYYKNNQFGILDVERGNVTNFHEKKISINVNTGIYVFSKKVLDLIKKNKKVKDITDLFDLLLSKNFSIKAYNLFEFWSDLGTQKSLNKIKKIK